MKVFVAHFTAECNEHISHVVDKNDFLFLYGDECIAAMNIKEVFEKENIEIIPSIYANVNPNGMISLDTFKFIKETIISKLKECVDSIDGVYLQFHGASGVKGLDCVSGEHDILDAIRKVTGKYMPIAMVMDPHGNLTNELADKLNIVRCYRESPHSDAVDTEIKVAKLLVDLIKNKRVMHPIVKKIPIMVGGERSVSANEPVASVNKMLDEYEKDDRVFSTSLHIGYIRHDDDKLGAAITVIPSEDKYSEYCNEIAIKLSNYVWEHRHEFKFNGNYDEVDASVLKAIAYDGKTVVITDSGDNCGAGGYGQNTVVLREFLKQKTDKKILFAGINDKKAYKLLSTANIGDSLNVNIGIEEDELSKAVNVDCHLIAIGEQKRGYALHDDCGLSYLINIDNTNIDILVLNDNIQYGTMEQFDYAKAPFHDYDIVIVKMGYLDTYLIPETKYHIMALTDGPTIQRSEKIPFKKIARPMYPIDDFDELYFIN